MVGKLVVAAMVAVLCVSGTPGAAFAETGRPAWHDCDRPVEGIQCAELPVPADWKRPRGARTTIGLAKLPARDPRHRAGSLVVNLGGPGPLIDNLPGVRERLAELTNWFDVIALDPRGMGDSAGITCPEAAPEWFAVWTSHDERTWNEFARANGEWAAGCERVAGPLAGNLDAWQVAHDLEAVRVALGEGGLNYYGNSYGTVYGQTYADLFPTRVHRMYLDSVADHTTRSAFRATAPMAGVMGEEFRRFGQWCVTDARCAVHPADGRDVWDRLLAEAARKPLPAPGAGPGATVGPDQLRFAAFNTVLRESRWPAFAEALGRARAGDATGLYVGTPPPSPDTMVSNVAWCADFPFTQDHDGMRRLDHRLRAVEPRIGWLMGRFQYARCAGMRGQGTFPPRPVGAVGLPPVLLVNGLHDASTTAAAGRVVAGQLPGSVWIGADAGHGVYLDGNRCVRDVVHRYLRTGERPVPGTVCPRDGA
ncbi:alpha/beta fold hydrolase [Amycolatopsis suaedae]|uniref:Alpha/beta fold hydrolase n=1 Tax=Amycolatopsis suaedae TaxID=2510978 RepID=A0A4Q7IZI4_9PSEU|nr:alpha/beta fold hydrolase [Amycolatopsis suaedae]RZQ59516.1 alpha/beta fold hydrolase [Amycolatopsis suaedae]